MSDEAIIERMFAQVMKNGDLEVADGLFADDFVDHGPSGDIHGREAFKELVSRWRSAAPDLHCGPFLGWLDLVELIEGAFEAVGSTTTSGSVLSGEWISTDTAASPSARRARPWA